MKSLWDILRGYLTLEGISMTRRHLYFYLILALITVLVHSLWKNLNTEPIPTDTSGHASRPAVQHLATTIEPFYEWFPDGPRQ